MVQGLGMRLEGAWFKLSGLGFQTFSRARVMEGGKPGLIDAV